MVCQRMPCVSAGFLMYFYLYLLDKGVRMPYNIA